MNKEEAVQLVGKYRRMYSKAYIFGSVARGEEDEYSDLDLIVVRETELPFPDRARELLPLLKEAKGAELLVYTPDEFRRQLEKGGFIADAVKEAVAIEGELGGSSQVVETG